MQLTEVTSLSTGGAEIFGTLTEAQLRNRLEPQKGVFIAESPKVIKVALDAGYEPVSLLCERRHITGDAAPVIQQICAWEENHHVQLPLFTGERELLGTLTGYTLTRGVLCAMRRPHPLSPAEICENARRLVIIDAVVDSTNVGAIFRSAAALGIDGVLLTPATCDPLNRRAVRVSMGSVFLVPWTRINSPSDVQQFGFRTAAMALTERSLSLSDARLKEEQRLALIMGNEGDGLPTATIEAADYVVRIPMKHGVDSLNVAAAAAVAFWELRSE